MKAVVKRKEEAWKEVLRARGGDTRERCLEVYREEKKTVKGASIKVRRSSKNSLKGR